MDYLKRTLVCFAAVCITSSASAQDVYRQIERASACNNKALTFIAQSTTPAEHVLIHMGKQPAPNFFRICNTTPNTLTVWHDGEEPDHSFEIQGFACIDTLPYGILSVGVDNPSNPTSGFYCPLL